MLTLIIQPAPSVFVTGRAGIVSVAVSFTDLAMPVVDEEFRPLVPGDVPGYVSRLALRVMDTRVIGDN